VGDGRRQKIASTAVYTLNHLPHALRCRVPRAPAHSTVRHRQRAAKARMEYIRRKQKTQSGMLRSIAPRRSRHQYQYHL